jgi:hypothetical protein
MAPGRLIRVKKYRGDPKAVAYIVALTEKNSAEDLIRQKVAAAGDEVEDLGRVSEALLQALSLAPGDFVRADGAQQIAQQPPPRANDR